MTDPVVYQCPKHGSTFSHRIGCTECIRDRLLKPPTRRSAIESLARELWVIEANGGQATNSVTDAITFYTAWDARKADIDKACETTT